MDLMYLLIKFGSRAQNALYATSLLSEDLSDFNQKWGKACHRCLCLHFECSGPSDPRSFPHMKCTCCQRDQVGCKYTTSALRKAPACVNCNEKGEPKKCGGPGDGDDCKESEELGEKCKGESKHCWTRSNARC